MYDVKIKGGKRENDIMLTVMSAVLSALAKEGRKEENIDAVVGFITKSGMKIGSKVMEYLEKKKQGSAEEGIPDGVQKEVEEQDYYIGDDCLYLNLSFDDLDGYYRIYDDKGIRMLADALNHLLGDRYITRFVTY